MKTTDEKINWGKEILDCIDEIKFGLEEKAAIKIPNIITLELSLDIASAVFKNNKGDDSDSGITSGFKVAVSLGNENIPIIQNSIELSKIVPTGGTAFDLLQIDYEVKTEFELNTDTKISLPVGITGLAVTINTSEIEDLGTKIVNKIISYFK